MSKRFLVAVLVSTTLNIVIVLVGAIVVLSVPSAAQKAPILLLAIALSGLVTTPLIAWDIAPRLKLRASRPVSGK